MFAASDLFYLLQPLLKKHTVRAVRAMIRREAKEIPTLMQFDAIDGVARAVTTAALKSGTSVPALTVSMQPNDARFLGRAELTLVEENGDRVDAHFYEAYWTPLTEGKVTLSQTLAFLRDAGLRGMWFAFKDGVFDRWMFSIRQEFAIPPERVFQLGLSLWTLVLMGAAFSALALVPVLKFVDWFRGAAVKRNSRATSPTTESR